ncbi:MAG: MATE family efflux transporter [Cytophagaceae bacterium]|jgi:MATE family multidrug resistance protein|nr:MATE family efflux transporter [Cytophagaceae bacterium]
MKYSTHIRDTFWLALPVAFSQLGHIMVGLVDTYMAVRISEQALSSVTVALSVYFPLFMFYIGLSYGFTPLIAQAHGENNPPKISGILYHALLINFGIALVLSLLLAASTQIIPHLGQPIEIVPDAIRFLKILVWTIFPVSLFQILRQFIEGLGHTKQAMVISVSGNILNIVLNYIFVEGWWEVPAMGVEGIAYATLTARIFMAFCMTGYVYFSGNYDVYLHYVNIKKLSVSNNLLKQVIPNKKTRWNPVLMKWVWNKSFPTGFQMSFEGTAFSVAAIYVGNFGVAQLAAHQITLNLASVTYMAASGIAAAGTVRVGYLFGQKNKVELQKAGFSAIGMVILFMSLCSFLFVMLHQILPQLFTDDPYVITISGWLLWMTAFFQLSDGIQVTSMGALRGISDVKIPSIIAFVSYWAIGLPCGYYLAFGLGWEVYGIWVGLTIGLVIASVVLWRRFYRLSSVLSFTD